jgi:hypothetical protein
MIFLRFTPRKKLKSRGKLDSPHKGPRSFTRLTIYFNLMLLGCIEGGKL